LLRVSLARSYFGLAWARTRTKQAPK